MAGDASATVVDAADAAELERLRATVAKLRSDLARREREAEGRRSREAQQHQLISQLTVDVARLTTTRVAPDRPELDLMAEEAVGLRRQIDVLSADLAKQAFEVKRLKREGDRFRATLNQAGEAILVVDIEARTVVDVNQTACDWFHRPRELMLFRRIDDLDLEFSIPTPTLRNVHATDTRRTGRPYLVQDGLVRRRNGTVFVVEVALTRARMDDRPVTIVVARDVHARRRRQEELRDAQSAFRSLFALCSDAVYLSSRDGSIADVNDAAVALFGYPRAEFLGLPAVRLYQEPDDIRGFQDQIGVDGFARDVPVTLVTKSGATFAASLSATVRQAGGGDVFGYQCLIRPRPAPR